MNVKRTILKLPFALQSWRLLKYGTLKDMYEWPKEKLMRANMHYYKQCMGYTFDINHPRTFTEKIQWYKFFYERDDFANIVDKVLFKSFIEQRLGPGYVIPMYGAWNSVEALEKDWINGGGVNFPMNLC